jgi:uncharacterized protein
LSLKNAKSYAVDAGAISLYYSGDQKVRPYFDRILDGRTLGFISEVNLAEYYYKSVEKLGKQTTEIRYLQTRQSRFNIVSPDVSITRKAALWKVKRRDLSLADCFALATLEEKAQILLTTDPVFRELQDVNLVYFSPRDA